MPFNSLLFLFVFAPLFFLAYRLAGERWKNAVCLAGSVAFYVWAEPLFAIVVVFSSAIDHWAALNIARSSDPRRRKWWLALALAQGLGLLFYYKYAAFFYGLAAEVPGLPLQPGWLGPALPLAISFVTFEKITYLVDIYRGLARPANRFSDYMTYVLLFPKLVAGPIIKFRDIEDQLSQRQATVEDFSVGLLRFAAGLGKKVIIADGLAPYAEAAFGADPGSLTATGAWIGIVAFTFQIYFDFSGYSDMAIGLSRMMGFRLPENFNQPYLAVGFSAFWRRWHISLSTWIRDYLFIPLGGSRVESWKIYRNLLICFTLSGLWHGASLTFVAWGLYHGLFLVADRFGLTRLLLRLPTPLGIAATLLAVMVGWVLFRATSFAQALGYLAAMVSPGREAVPVVFLDWNFLALTAAALVLSFLPVERVRALVGDWNAPRLPAVGSWLIVCGFLWACFRLPAASYTAFLYFRF